MQTCPSEVMNATANKDERQLQRPQQRAGRDISASSLPSSHQRLLGDVRVILNMIVKDEVKSLPGLLDSVRNYVTDYVIVDTGSSDGTPQLLEERGIKVYYKAFENFATTRNYALSLAEQVAGNCRAYIMVLDADFMLKVEKQKEYLALLGSYGPDAIKMVQKLDLAHYANVRFVKAHVAGARWVGAVHEYLGTNARNEFIIPTEVSIKTINNDGYQERGERQGLLISHHIHHDSCDYIIEHDHH